MLSESIIKAMLISSDDTIPNNGVFCRTTIHQKPTKKRHQRLDRRTNGTDIINSDPADLKLTSTG